jgi:murein L,D-transpeptidase YafK
MGWALDRAENGQAAMIGRRGLLLGAAALPLASCGVGGRDWPTADLVVVQKSERRLILAAGGKALADYTVNLGFQPEGHKAQERDGRTPEGEYFIDRRNHRSDYHLSLGISYPNPADVARARAMGVDPGGDIFIHGSPTRPEDRGKRDWTAGCIAVTDRQIEEIWQMVPLGTRITILA